MTILGGDIKRCNAIFIGLINPCSFFDQELGYLEVIILGGNHQRSPAISCSLIDCSPLIDQKLG